MGPNKKTRLNAQTGLEIMNTSQHTFLPRSSAGVKMMVCKVLFH